jgi:Helicase HerA, central domain
MVRDDRPRDRRPQQPAVLVDGPDDGGAEHQEPGVLVRVAGQEQVALGAVAEPEVDVLAAARTGPGRPTARRPARVPAPCGRPVRSGAMSDHDALLAQRRELAERFAVAPVAWSSDGRTVGFAGPLELGVDVGGLALVGDPGGGRLVVQIRGLEIVERDALSIDVDVSDVAPNAVSASVRPRFRSLNGTAVVLGELTEAGFDAMAALHPFGERPIEPADSEQVVATVDALDGGAPTVEIGTVVGTTAPARLRSAGFSRHTFMCGQSGSGKTYTTGLLFERLLAATELPIIVLDPNSDHVFLGQLLDPADTSPEAQRYREVAARVKVARARGLPADHTLCADFSDLHPDVQALLLRLDPIRDLDQYAALRRLTARLGDTYSIHDLADAAAADDATSPIATRIGNLGLAEWELWRRDGETSVAAVGFGSARCVVLDLGSLARPEERSIVALALLGRRWAMRAQRSPMLLAVDEAHNVFPAATDDPLLRASADLGVLIAGEGRKYGLHLMIATQRPGKVHPNVVSQCDNLVLMRMNGSADIEDLVALFSHVPAPLLRRALGFGLGQALVAGPIRPVPLVAQIGARRTPEGGGDVPTTWAAPHA